MGDINFDDLEKCMYYESHVVPILEKLATDLTSKGMAHAFIVNMGEATGTLINNLEEANIVRDVGMFLEMASEPEREL